MGVLPRMWRRKLQQEAGGFVCVGGGGGWGGGGGLGLGKSNPPPRGGGDSKRCTLTAGNVKPECYGWLPGPERPGLHKP